MLSRSGLAGLGQLDEALAAVNEGLDGAVQGEHGYDLFFAELLRIKGEILLRRGAVTAAEDSFREAINIARQQEALFWELRASLSLARLCVRTKAAATRQDGLWLRFTIASPRGSGRQICARRKRSWTNFRGNARSFRSGQVEERRRHRVWY